MSIRFLTAGESHGKALVGILEGIPAGLSIDFDFIQNEMKRRKLGYGRSFRQKIEDDQVECLSGVRHGVTLGSPIALMIQNKDWENWKTIMKSERLEPSECEKGLQKAVSVPRPGHADWIGGIKYGHSDMRNVLERASARETAMRVALGSIAKIFLIEFGIRISSRVVQIGRVQDQSELESLGVSLHLLNEKTDVSAVRCANPDLTEKMIAEIEQAQANGNTVGGVFEVYASGLPQGLGSYVQWDRRLEGVLAHAFMSLNAIKSVEIGLGLQAASLLGSSAHDEMILIEDRVQLKTNRSGGIDGGMSTGQPLIVRCGMKPLATLMKPLQSVDLRTHESAQAHVERSDICAVPAAAVIAESLLALSLVEVFQEKYGGDSIEEIRSRI